MIESGGDADAVEAAVAAVRSTDKVLFTVDTLEFLRRGGRIGGARALLGSMLDIKPILEIRDGRHRAGGAGAHLPARHRPCRRGVQARRRRPGAAPSWSSRTPTGPSIAAELVERMRPLVSSEPSLTVVGPVVGLPQRAGRDRRGLPQAGRLTLSAVATRVRRVSIAVQVERVRDIATISAIGRRRTAVQAADIDEAGRRSQIVRAAAAVLGRQGYAETSLKDVAREAEGRARTPPLLLRIEGGAAPRGGGGDRAPDDRRLEGGGRRRSRIRSSAS